MGSRGPQGDQRFDVLVSRKRRRPTVDDATSTNRDTPANRRFIASRVAGPFFRRFDAAHPPSVASVSLNSTPPSAGATPSPNNGTLPNGEPRKVKTFAVHDDEPDPRCLRPNPMPAPLWLLSLPPFKICTACDDEPGACSTIMPLSLTPHSQPAPASEPRVAATTPPQTAPSGGGGYLVQVSSQRNEADAQASFKALQNKFPSILGSQIPVIKRADLGEKGVYYRAMVGPFGSSDEAALFCGNLKNFGGQCVVQNP